MFLIPALRYALLLLVPICACLSSYLYLYPLFHFCAFPSPEQNRVSNYLTTIRGHNPFLTPSSTKIAPFRLLALGDPQLEGDSSIDNIESIKLPSLRKFWQHALLLDGTNHSPLQRLRYSLHSLIDFYLDDLPNAMNVWRKRLDHIGNDYYLGHIYRTIHWWSNPTHVTVLGDLLGSQWIDDEEFDNRGWRFWNRVFKGGAKVEEEFTLQPSKNYEDVARLEESAASWRRRIINVAGNHDVGYAGDLSHDRLARFTRNFGKANYELRFQMSLNLTRDLAEYENERELPIPEIRLVILNDMNLDTPAGSKELQDETYSFLNNIITNSYEVDRLAHFTLVLTHIPLFKEAGICVDSPFFDFFDGLYENGVREQNHLSRHASKVLLEGIFGKSGRNDVPGQGFGRRGAILNGHDHEGCDILHYINQSETQESHWEALTWEKAQSLDILHSAGIPSLREITVRSMMGDFSGNAGLMSLWFDEDTWQWRFEFTNCQLGKQHIWWVVHLMDLVTLGMALIYGGLLLAQRLSSALPSLNTRESTSCRTIPSSQEKSCGLTALGEPMKAGHLDIAA